MLFHRPMISLMFLTIEKILIKNSYCTYCSLFPFFLNFRRYTQETNTFYYPHEKYYGTGPTPELPGWDNNTTETGDHAIPVHLFSKHVSELHLDQV